MRCKPTDFREGGGRKKEVIRYLVKFPICFGEGEPKTGANHIRCRVKGGDPLGKLPSEPGGRGKRISGGSKKTTDIETRTIVRGPPSALASKQKLGQQP